MIEIWKDDYKINIDMTVDEKSILQFIYNRHPGEHK